MTSFRSGSMSLSNRDSNSSLRLFIFLIALLFPPADWGEQANAQAPTYRESDVEYTNLNEGIVLSGTLTLPLGEGPFPAVVLIHGSGPWARGDTVFGHRPFETLAHDLAGRGIASLRYDKRGCGRSKGQYVPYELEKFASDGLATVGYLKSRSEIQSSSIGAIGLSQGGLVAPMMAAQSSDVSFLVLLGAPGVWGKEFFAAQAIAIARASGFQRDDFESIRSLYNRLYPLWIKDRLSSNEEKRMKETILALWRYEDEATRIVLGDTNVDQAFAIMRMPSLRSALSHNPAHVLGQVSCPVLAITGGKDVQAPPASNLPAIEQALHDGKCPLYRIVELENHNHLFQRCITGKVTEYNEIREDLSREALAIIGQWIQQRS